MSTSELFPRACTPDECLKTETDWSVLPTRIVRGATIGSNAIIIYGITVGCFALVDARAVSTCDTPDSIGDVRDREDFLTTATGMAAL